MRSLMARFKTLFVPAFLLLAVCCTQCQLSPAQQQTDTQRTNYYLKNQLIPVTNVQASVNGALGSCTYYYWVVANYTFGPTSPGGPSAAVTTSNCTLSGSNYNIVSWPANNAASTFDVLRTTTPTPPTGACACAVATGVTTNSQKDTSNTLSAYTVQAATFTRNAILSLQNIPISTAVSHLQLFQGSTLINDLSTPTAALVTVTGTNGYSLQLVTNQEQITLDTGNKFTNSTTNLIPANATIVDVSCRVTTTITTAVNWAVSCEGSDKFLDPSSGATPLTCGAADSTGNKFNLAVDTNLTSGTILTLNTASFGGGSPVSFLGNSAHKLRILNDANPGAGVVRCSVTAWVPSGPTS